MSNLTVEARAAVLRLLQDVAESEHRLRHSRAFEAVVSELGFDLVAEPHRVTVADPQAPKEATQVEPAPAATGTGEPAA